MQAVIKTSILSGTLIGLGAWGNLLLGGIPGSILFSFGLLCIIKLGIPLYTGRAGNVDMRNIVYYKDSMIELGKILLGNIIGCAIVGGFFYSMASHELHLKAISIVESRYLIHYPSVFTKAIVCGIIIDICVWISNNKNSIVPIFLGVPLFILLGSLHCVAEAGYLAFAPEAWSWKLLIYYPVCVIGNYLGCSFRRLFI